MDKFLALSTSEIKDLLIEFLYSYVKINCKYQSPILVGHSFGGYLAAAFCTKYSTICKNVILINPTGFFPIAGPNHFFWSFFFYYGLPNLLVRQFRNFFNFLFSLYILFFKVNDPIFYYNLFQMSCKNNYGHIVVSKFISFNGYTSNWNDCVFNNLITLKNPVPILLIYGEDDTIIPKEHFVFIKQYFENQDGLIPIKNCWHSPSEYEHYKIIGSSIENVSTVAQKLKTINNSKLDVKINKIFSEYKGVWCPHRTISNRNKMFKLLEEMIDKFNQNRI